MGDVVAFRKSAGQINEASNDPSVSANLASATVTLTETLRITQEVMQKLTRSLDLVVEPEIRTFLQARCDFLSLKLKKVERNLAAAKVAASRP